MKHLNETGRTMVEIISVLVIIGILSVVGIWGYSVISRRNKVEEILNALQMKTVEIHSAIQRMGVNNKEELDKFLAGHTTSVAGYQLSFHSDPDGAGFVSEIVGKNGEPIKGAMCRELITKMAEQKFVSDVDFTLKEEEMEDGSISDVSVPLNGKYVDLRAVCGG